MYFKIKYIDNRKNIRLGIISSSKKEIKTPAFLFCATKGEMKNINTKEIKNETQGILINTYHLLSQSYENILEYKKISNILIWNKYIISDSGGFQIFSLGHGIISKEIKRKKINKKRKKLLLGITEEGAIIKSIKNNKIILVTPERSILIQKKIRSNIIISLDECTSMYSKKIYVEKSMQISNRWAIRSYKYFKKINNNKEECIYGIIQGGSYIRLRKKNCKILNSIKFFGNAIGGSIGKNKIEMKKTLSKISIKIDKKKAIHLLGIGGIKDIITNTKNGIDTFDCVYITRISRHGTIIINKKNKSIIANLNNKEFKYQNIRISKNCLCKTCKKYKLSYICYLLKNKKEMAIKLITIHNIYYINNLMKKIRKNIIENKKISIIF